MIKKEPVTIRRYDKWDLIRNSKLNFYKYYRDSQKFDNLSFKSKYLFLVESFKDLNKLRITNTEKHKNKKQKRKKQMCMIQL